jgi:membrane-bound lytic murein transglycosylase D
VGSDPARWIARVPKKLQYQEQERLRYYQVRRGDTLSKIAKANGTSVGAIAALNNLPSRHRIYVGQVLDLPDPRSRGGSRSLVRKAHARVKPSPDQIEPAPSRPPPLAKDSIWRRIDGDFVLVDSDETLAHFADWLKVSAARLRKLNGLRRGRALHMGQRLRLDFSRVSEQAFLQRRLEFHKSIEEDFFGTYRVAGTVEHKIRRGESLWALAHQIYRVPIWLIHRYNPDVNLSDLHPGTKLRIPVVERLTKS